METARRPRTHRSFSGLGNGRVYPRRRVTNGAMDEERDEQRERQAYERTHDPAGVMALTDGVFAIILTLLVLEIHVPELSGGQTLREALEEIRPSFVAFLITFVVVAISWVGHRDLFAHVRRTDRPLIWLNVLYMLPLCLLPFGASLIARYQAFAVALEIYGWLLVAIALTRVWMF